MSLDKEIELKSLSEKSASKISIIIGCIVACYLDNKTKNELVSFMVELEDYFENESEQEEKEEGEAETTAAEILEHIKSIAGVSEIIRGGK